jgi:beta-ribofuranosylaminobenzene 5'-phosphate synthase
MQGMKLQITTPCRIHATLIDMNGSIGRIDGGIGFTLSNPSWKIDFETTESPPIMIDVPKEVGGNYIDVLVSDVLKNFGSSSDKARISIKVRGIIPRHVGLGSKTQLALALGDGISRLLKLDNTPLSKEILASIVKRGGTSGIGVTSYFHGGAIIDGGHEFGVGKEKESFLPSSASSASPAPVLSRDDLPVGWRAVIGIPMLEKGAHDAEEVGIFKHYCPVPIAEVQQLSHVILMKLLPAIKQQRFNEICACINIFQNTGFKKVEVDLRGKAYRRMLQDWRDAGAPCSGMSSFGPAIYSLAENDAQAFALRKSLDSILRPHGGTSFISKLQNTGAIINYST